MLSAFLKFWQVFSRPQEMVKYTAMHLNRLPRAPQGTEGHSKTMAKGPGCFRVPQSAHLCGLGWATCLGAVGCRAALSDWPWNWTDSSGGGFALGQPIRSHPGLEHDLGVGRIGLSSLLPSEGGSHGAHGKHIRTEGKPTVQQPLRAWKWRCQTQGFPR